MRLTLQTEQSVGAYRLRREGSRPGLECIYFGSWSCEPIGVHRLVAVAVVGTSACGQRRRRGVEGRSQFSSDRALCQRLAQVSGRGDLPSTARFCQVLSTMPERGELAIAATNGALGQAVGQLYAQRYFPPEAKKKAQAMVATSLRRTALASQSLLLDVAADQRKSIGKAGRACIGVGYPDKWIDYSTLEVVRGDAFGNMRRAEAFNRSLNLAKLQQPADPDEWRIDRKIVGAVIVFSPNTETFSAGIFSRPTSTAAATQPPITVPPAPAWPTKSVTASTNSARSTTRRAVSALVDCSGSRRIPGEAAELAAQFDGYCPFPDLCVNGKQVSAKISPTWPDC